MDTYVTKNSDAWACLARDGCESSRPYGPAELSCAQAWIDPYDWMPWEEVRSALCLAGGGGQQAPLLAALDLRVTVADLCAEQLALDAEVATSNGLDIECVQADMLDLSSLYDRDFDLVYQPNSSCYVPDVRRLYAEVSRVLRPGGWYDVEHSSPIHLQLRGFGEWRDGAYALSRARERGIPIPWRLGRADEDVECWHYVHSLGDLIGGLCAAGMRVQRFAEPTHGDDCAQASTAAHLSAYAPPFFRMLARRECLV